MKGVQGRKNLVFFNSFVFPLLLGTALLLFSENTEDFAQAEA